MTITLFGFCFDTIESLRDLTSNPHNDAPDEVIGYFGKHRKGDDLVFDSTEDFLKFDNSCHALAETTANGFDKAMKQIETMDDSFQKVLIHAELTKVADAFNAFINYMAANVALAHRQAEENLKTFDNQN